MTDGVLTITARPASQAIQAETNWYDYTSGMLTTYSSFAQTYGYFEMRADMPDDQGAWPAFWLLRPTAPGRRNWMWSKCTARSKYGHRNRAFQ